MKLLTILLLSAISLGALSACNVTARDKDGYISAGTNDGHYRSGRDDGYYHCPPGHAKKGWC